MKLYGSIEKYRKKAKKTATEGSFIHGIYAQSGTYGSRGRSIRWLLGTVL
jgi:hypothetical protein